MSDTYEPTTASETSSPQDEQSTEHEIKAASYCSNHPKVTAEETCGRCKAPICITCAFTFPNDLLLCPSCATEKPEVMTPKRRKGRLISFVMAGIASFFLILLFGGAMFPILGNMPEEDYEAFLGVLFIFLILVPAVVGLSFGIGVLNKRRGNPMSVLAPVIWNGILLGIWIFLTILGTFA